MVGARAMPLRHVRPFANIVKAVGRGKSKTKFSDLAMPRRVLYKRAAQIYRKPGAICLYVEVWCRGSRDGIFGMYFCRTARVGRKMYGAVHAGALHEFRQRRALRRRRFVATGAVKMVCFEHLTRRCLQIVSVCRAIFMRHLLCENGIYLHLYAEKCDFYLSNVYVNNNFY